MWDLSYIITNLIHTKLKGQGSNHCLPPSWVGAPSKETWASCDHFQKLFHANIICSSAQCKLIYRCYFATEEQKTRVVFSEFVFQSAVIIGIWCLENWSEFPPKYPFWTRYVDFFSSPKAMKKKCIDVLYFFSVFCGKLNSMKITILKNTTVQSIINSVDSSWLNRPLKQVFWSRKPITEMVEITRWIFCTLQIFACQMPTIHKQQQFQIVNPYI